MFRILATLGKSSRKISLGKRVASHKYCTVCGRVLRVSSLTVLREGGELKTGCISSQKKLTVAQASDSPKSVLFITRGNIGRERIVYYLKVRVL